MRLRVPGLGHVDERSFLEPLAGIVFVTIVTLGIGVVAFGVALAVGLLF